MDFLNIFKGFLGFPNHKETSIQENDNRSKFLRRDDEDVFSRTFQNDEDQMSFNVFSNPLEMHRYFEKQMKDMLKVFGITGPESPSMFPGEGSFFGFPHGGSFFGFRDASTSSDFSSMDEPQEVDPSNLRDYYLKHGYEKDVGSNVRTDSDLDGKVDTGDLDSIFKKENNQISPYQGAPGLQMPRIQMFGQSITSKTVRNADGTIESHRTVRDHQGNEETVVTRKYGDQEYTIITKTDKDGKKEVTENMLNLDEKDIQSFLGHGKNNERVVPPIDGKPHNWFDFDKYFK